MMLYRHFLPLLALLILLVPSRAADIGVWRQHVVHSIGSVAALELRPGRSDTLSFDRDVQSLLISDPAIAEAVVLTTRTIVVTGKAVGLADLIVLDRTGATILNRSVQVLADVQPKTGLFRPLARDVRVRSFGAEGQAAERVYLCAPGCSQVQR